LPSLAVTFAERSQTYCVTCLTTVFAHVLLLGLLLTENQIHIDTDTHTNDDKGSRSLMCRRCTANCQELGHCDILRKFFGSACSSAVTNDHLKNAFSYVVNTNVYVNYLVLRSTGGAKPD